MYGSLSLICGPMFSGKTTELLKRILWVNNAAQQKIAVFKPAFDKRYAKLQIVSHEGLSAAAEAINCWGAMSERLKDDAVREVFFDEVQFFTKPHFEGDILAIIKDLLADEINVTASGLDMDWTGKPFEISGQLAAMAEEFIKVKAVCNVCGRPASRTYKKSGSGAQVEIGGTDMYQARCLYHWSQPDAGQGSLFPEFSSVQMIKLASV